MTELKRKRRGRLFVRGINAPKISNRFISLFFISALLLVSGGRISAQSLFPAGDFWSLDAGAGVGGMMEEGKSIQLIVDPKLWLSPALMVGAKAGVNYSIEGGAPNPDPDATSDALMLEGQVYLRWNFLRLGQNINKQFNIFVQGGLGLVAAYRGSDNPFDNQTETRGSVLFDGALGVTIPLTERWHIEPLVRGGYPHIFGLSLSLGYKFQLPERTRTEYIRGDTRVEYREVLKTVPPIEMVKVLNISAVEFILFGPDIGSYNLGVDRDGQALNDLVMNRTAEFLKEHPDYIVRLEGNANPVTTDPEEANELMALSLKRSNTVAAEFEKRGVPREQMAVMAFGGTRTVTSERERWDMNRRVELIIMSADSSGSESGAE